MTAQKKKPRTKFTPAMKARICREVSLGKSLRKVLKQKGMPSISRVMAVLQEDEAWQEHYARSRKAGIELHVDGMIDLADEATEDNAHAIRVRVDTRKWIASKLLPKVYGDKVAAEVTVTDDTPRHDREALILETGRRLAYLFTAATAAAARSGVPALPAPALSGQGKGSGSTYETSTQPSVSMDQSTKQTHEAQGAADAAERAERIYENEVAADVRRHENAPLRIAPGRLRPRWQR